MIHHREPEDKEKLKAVQADFVRIRDTYRKAIESAGFKVTSNAGHQRTVLVITSGKVSERFFEQTFTLAIENDYRSCYLVGVYRVCNTTYGGKPRRYKKFDTVNLVKLMDMLRAAEEMAIKMSESHTAAETEVAQRQDTMVKELGGTVMPPGTEVHPILGNGPDAGKYHINFKRFGNSNITGTPLNAEQVKKLVALLNELQGTNKLFMVQAGIEGGRDYFWTGTSWSAFSHDGPATYTSKEKAEEALVLAKDKMHHGNAEFEVVPYYTYSVIA